MALAAMLPATRISLCAAALLWPSLGYSQQFFQFTIDQDHLSGAPDASSLNRPLAAGDKLKVCGEDFCRVSDGERVRLFGVNLNFGNNFPPQAEAPRLAKRLRRLGVNVIRFTHMDTKPGAGSLLTTGPYPTLNPVSVERLRAFLDALKAEGIYADLNLHVGYTFRPSVDNVPAIAQFPYHSKPLHTFHPRLVDLQCQYARKVIEALKLRDDPVLGVVELSNESSLIWAWQVNRLNKYLVGDYCRSLQDQWNAFLKARYVTTAKLREAWGASSGGGAASVARKDPGNCELVDGGLVCPNAATAANGTSKRGLNPDESLEAANVALIDDDVTPGRRLDDYLSFLIDVDRAYFKQMLAAVRDTAGPLVPVAGTQVRYGGLENFESHRDVDFQDNHYYVDHYNYKGVDYNSARPEIDARNWRMTNSSGIATGLSMVSEMASQRQAGRPYTMSEVNQPWPNMQGNEIDVVTAALGAFQDWSAVMHFGYDWTTPLPGGFNLNGESSKQALFGQAAWLFRSGAIQTGKTPVNVPLSADLRLRALREKLNALGVAKFLADQTGYDPANVFVHPVKLVMDGSGSITQTAKPAAPYQADTGELTYDPQAKLYLIHAPQAAGVFGYPGNRPVSAGPLEVQLAAGARGYATILLTSLDARPLAESRHLLLSTPGYVIRSRAGSNPPTPQKMVKYPAAPGWWTLEPDPGSNKPSGALTGGTAPVWMERVESTVHLTTHAKNLRVYPLSETGSRLAALTDSDVRQEKDGFRIHLQADGQPLSPWFELSMEP
jgi:hypothetical protein